MKQYLMHINGEWAGKNLDTMDVINPATNKSIGTVPAGGEDETNQAIEAAHQAFGPWSKETAYVRSGHLKRLNELMLDHMEELAQIMTLEMGKPINESRGEVKYAASFIEWFAEDAKRMYGDPMP